MGGIVPGDDLPLTGGMKIFDAADTGVVGLDGK